MYIITYAAYVISFKNCIKKTYISLLLTVNSKKRLFYKNLFKVAVIGEQNYKYRLKCVSFLNLKLMLVKLNDYDQKSL